MQCTHLSEKAPRHGLLEPPLLGDEVEEVLAARRPLEDEDVGVGPLVEVQQAHDARHARHLPQQADLQRDALAVVLKERAATLFISELSDDESDVKSKTVGNA